MINIFGHAIYQLVVVFTILFAGPFFFNVEDATKLKEFKPTQHYTMIFNAFVLMTLFNEINARKIHGERNVFKGILTNPIFYSIWIITLFLQVIIL
jgi:magnesium-transporting ATPase (P-type)